MCPSYLTDHEKNWRNAASPTMAKYARSIRDQQSGPPTTEITASHILEIMRPIWLNKKYETARRVAAASKSAGLRSRPDDLSYVNRPVGPSNCAGASRSCCRRSDQKITLALIRR
jgi:hypothetical protein